DPEQVKDVESQVAREVPGGHPHPAQDLGQIEPFGQGQRGATLRHPRTPSTRPEPLPACRRADTGDLRGIHGAPSRVADAGGLAMSNHLTLLELVSTVAAHAATEDELVATIVHLVNSGAVRLCGNFRGARFDLRELRAA